MTHAPYSGLPLVDLLDKPESSVPLFQEGFPYREHLNLLIGAGGSGKSFLALELAVSTVLGQPIAGFRPHLPESLKKVLVFAGEDSSGDLLARLEAIRDSCGVEWREIEEALKDKRLAFVTHHEPLLTTVDGRPGPPGALGRRLQESADAEKPSLIVIDPLVVYGGVVDENSASQMGTAAEYLKDLARRSGGAVLVLHHSPKPGEGKYAKLPSQHESRGSSALVNAARSVLLIRPNRQDRAGLHLVKNSYGRLRDFELARAENGTLRVIDGKTAGNVELRRIAEACQLAMYQLKDARRPTLTELKRKDKSTAGIFEMLERQLGCLLSGNEVAKAVNRWTAPAGDPRPLFELRTTAAGALGRSRRSEIHPLTLTNE